MEIASVVGVVCQPDKPASRGLKLTPPAVKVRAEALGLPVIQPVKLRTGEVASWVRQQNADVAVVIAYGRILPQDVLDGPRLGCLNLHASILPKYRGAAPITWAIANGERETGITLMKMDAGMDTGDILTVHATLIDPDETAGQLGERLGRLAAEVVRSDVARYVRGELTPTPQDHEAATMAPMLDKGTGRIDWTRPGQAVHDHVRAMNPWPMAWSTMAGARVIVHQTARVAGAWSAPVAPGTVVLADKSRVLVACASPDVVELARVQLEGRKPIRGAEWFLGRGVRVGDVFEDRR